MHMIDQPAFDIRRCEHSAALVSPHAAQYSQCSIAALEPEPAALEPATLEPVYGAYDTPK